MPRVYFDTNVYSNIQSASSESYRELLRLLTIQQSQLSIYFSYAHIRDKKKDLTDHKLQDFDFMETLVGDNYLAYDPSEKKPSLYLATPLMVYSDNPGNDLDILLKLFEPDENDDVFSTSRKGLLKSFFSGIALPKSSPAVDQLPEDQQKLIRTLIPDDGKNPTIFDLIKNMGNLTYSLSHDSELYKSLRKMIDDHFNKGMVKLSDETDFNELFKDTAFGKTYIDYLKDSIHFKDKDQIPAYDLYLLAYNMLDAFGIDKDKITAKNGLTNLQNDGLHSYFAQYCEFFITDDKVIARKSRALYGYIALITSDSAEVDQYFDQLNHL